MEKTHATSKILIATVIVSFLTSTIVGGALGFLSSTVANKYFFFPSETKNPEAINNKIISEESAITEAVEKVNPAVVSIIVTKDLPVIERYYDFFDPFGDDFFSPFRFRIPQERQKGTEKKEVGGGSGFIVSPEGLIITNKHVVADEEADYTVLTNEEKKYPAKILARDPSTDLAIIKIEAENLPYAALGDSGQLKLGQIVIAIGNALGEFRNTVSTGVVSGLSRSITAGGGGTETEHLEGVIQTDAAINPGNSGGPLVNLEGQVVGVNTAIVQGAENIGFALPINIAKKDLESVKAYGKIKRAYLGVRYVMINEEIKEKNNLSVDYGALVSRGEEPTDLAVMPSSPADRAGLVENDILLEVDGTRIDEKNSLAKIIQQKEVGEEISLKVLHKGEEKLVKVVLGELE